MSATYRITVYTDSVRENRIGAASFSQSFLVKRGSLKTDDEHVRNFRVALAMYVPDGRNARAWIERSDTRFGTETLMKVTGTSTKRTELPGQAIAGVWRDVLTDEEIVTGAVT